jgi:hypothetical protein
MGQPKPRDLTATLTRIGASYTVAMRVRVVAAGVCLLSLILCAQTSVAQADESRVTTKFQQVDTLFANPEQGWMAQPYQQPRFPASVVYLRFDWQQVEPADGTYDWTLIDRTIAEARRHQETVAIRVMTANAHTHGYYSSPKWLFDEGCKGFEYVNGGADTATGAEPIPRIEPDYADPIYLARHGAFMEAFGARYNGSPDIEFLDIGSYGIWGEWHTPHPASIAVREKIVDMYLKAFSKTTLVYMSDDAEVMNYALAHGAGLRRDGVGSPWHEQRWAGTPAYANVPTMGDVWKHAPIVFEWYGSYDYLKSRGWSFDSAVKFMLDNHVTMINDNFGTVPQEAMPQLDKLARLAGYRFVLRSLTAPKSMVAGGSLDLSMTWANVGVGKLYHAYELWVSLRDRAGAEVANGKAAADPRDWLPGEREVTTKLAVPAALQPGEYTLAIGLLDPTKQRPPLHVAIDAPEKDGCYTVGKIELQ